MVVVCGQHARAGPENPVAVHHGRGWLRCGAPNYREAVNEHGQALTAEDLELTDAARAAIDENTDAAPDSDGVHTMGAAPVRTDDDTVFVGDNVYHFTGGPCTELMTLGAARAGVARVIRTVVAVGNHGRGVIGPCGRDRQVFLDYYPGLRVLVPTAAGTVAMTPQQLLPAPTAWTFKRGSEPEHEVAAPR